MQELQLFDENQLKVTPPTVEFTAYEELKSNALQVAEYVSQIEVNDDNIKEVKKILATVNRSLKDLNDRRIAAKKWILEPYDTFADQVKEIEKIVKDADTLIRDRARDLEEQERQAKAKEIRKLWDLRIEQYEYAKIMDFDHFMTPQYANKTFSMKKVEKEMVDTLEKFERDLKILSTMDNSKNLISNYIETQSLSIVLEIEKQRQKEQEQIEAVMKENDLAVEDKKYIFEVFTEKDYNFVKSLMENNQIKYKEI